MRPLAILLLALACSCSTTSERDGSDTGDIGNLTLPPASPEVAAFLGQLEELRKAERYEEGIRLARDYLEQHPDAFRVHYGLGIMLGATDDHLAAIAEFEATLEHLPRHYGSHHGLAIAYTRMGELERSLPYLEACLAARPDDGDLSFQLGRNLSALGRLDEALPHARRAAELRLDGDAWTELGMIHRRQGNEAEAEQAFRAALAADPGHLASMFNLGQSLLRQGRSDSGQALLARHQEMAALNDRLEYYKRSSQLSGATAGNFMRLGEMQLARNLDEDAVKSFRQALDMDPDMARAALGLASTYLELGDLDQATQWCVYALSRDPEQWKTHFLLAILRIRRGNADAATRAIETSQQLEPWPASAWVHLADTYRGQGLLEQAADAYHGALELAPGHATAQQGLALVLYATGDEAAAARAAEAATEVDPGLGDAWMIQGLVRFNNHDAAGAENAFRSAVEAQRVSLLAADGAERIEGRFRSMPRSEAALELYRQLRDAGDAG